MPPLLSFPPWYEIDGLISNQFPEQNVKALSNQIINANFSHLLNLKYKDFIEVYTDGSKTSINTSSAFVIPSMSIEKSYKLSSEASVLTLELVAVLEAMKFIRQNTNFIKCVILTDSNSSVSLLKNSKLKEPIAKLILHELGKLDDVGRTTHIQWIPGHQGIQGNERADAAAKNVVYAQNLQGHRVCNRDYLYHLNIKIKSAWNTYWNNQVNNHNKGRALKLIKSSLAEWPWAHHKIRAVETAFSRLRIGHVSLKEHLFRFNLSPDPYCQCGEVESITHFLFHCSLQDEIRDELKREILQINQNITFDIKTLLGGNESLTEDQQFYIVSKVSKFLIKSRKLYSI